MKRFVLFVFCVFICTFALADTETVTWYKDGAVYDTTTCQTGDDVIVPSAPTKRGHIFNGWVFGYDFSTLDAGIQGESQTNNPSAHTWTTTFSYGLVSGIAVCSITKMGSNYVAGIPDELTPDGQYCWCKATAYTPSGSNIVYENVSASVWGYAANLSSASNCTSRCAYFCGDTVRVSGVLRRVLFGIK